MRKQNKVKQLQRTHSHRKAMLNNMVTSLLFHEQIQSTVAKAKVARQITEKLITRAKRNLDEATDVATKIHNIRIVNRYVKDQEVLNKLFNEIAPRFQERNGGYTRVLRIGRRKSDASEMAVVELVERKDKAQLKEEKIAASKERQKIAKEKKS